MSEAETITLQTHCRGTKHTGVRHEHQNQRGYVARRQRQKEEKVSRVRGAGACSRRAPVLLIDENTRNPMRCRASPPTGGHPWTASNGVRGDSPRISNAHKPASSARTIPPRARRRPPTKSKGERGASPAQAQRDQTNQNTTPPWTNTPSPTLPSTPTPRTSPHNPKKPPSQLFSLHNNTPIRKKPHRTPQKNHHKPPGPGIHPP